MTREQKRRRLLHRRIGLAVAFLVALAAIVALAFGVARLADAVKSPPAPSTTASSGTTTTTAATSPWDAVKNARNYVAALAPRYEAFAAANAALPLTDVVMQVNMGLDRPFYSEAEPIQNPEDLLVLCNKYHYLDAKFTPHDLVDVASRQTRSGARLRREADEAFDRLCAAAREDGVDIRITTAYRSYGFQKSLYNGYVAEDGVEAADTYSARPGYSEHQTGLAMDLGGKSASGAWGLSYFEDSPGFAWMQKHAVEYGFILRFPEDKVAVTGYQYEPWHYRYVGVEAAEVIWHEGLCLEEYRAKYMADKAN